ncbi:MAG: TNT domain-containing protein [Prevotellaceae bacterium]|jgi:hypothetical protein|nr:TNT domain-containing protein [Prevotellaceae bacterium]
MKKIVLLVATCLLICFVQAQDTIVRGVRQSTFLESFQCKGKCDSIKIWNWWVNRSWDSIEYAFTKSGDTVNRGWPPNDGFIEINIDILRVGCKVDRYGGYLDSQYIFRDNGKFVSPKGASYASRALLASDSAKKSYCVYEVKKAIPNVNKGKAIPWFKQEGQGMQFKLPAGIDSLLKTGHLKRIDSLSIIKR